MKTIKLILPDSTYNLALRHANTEGIDPAHYCSILITECLGHDGKPALQKRPVERRIPRAPIILGGVATLGRKLPDTVEQIFAICRYVWQDHMEYSDAVGKVARDLCVQVTTVRDKCTRRISLPDVHVDTDKFLDLLAHPSALIEHLCRKFQRFSAEINQLFEPILTAKN